MTVTVTQQDRDAAASIAVLVEMRELILAGRADHHAEPFARHREQARADAEREIVAYLRTRAAKCDEIHRGVRAMIFCVAADAIEQGAHHG